MAGHLIAFEGLDQSGKQTQAELLRDRLKQDGHKARLVSFPDYGTSIAQQIPRPPPAPALTIMLDIAPETAAARKSADRDRYERDLAMLGRVRESYRRQAAAGGWAVLDGERTKDTIAADVYDAARHVLT